MKRLDHVAGFLAAVAMTVSAMGQTARAEEGACPLPNQKTLLMVQLFFGLSVSGRSPVNPREWNRFVRLEVTPRFPRGLSVYGGYGQWLNPKTQAVIHENSKIMIFAAEDSESTRKKIMEVTESYRKAFRQQAVGILTNSVCAAF